MSDDVPLTRARLGSLEAVQFRNQLQAELDVRVPSTIMFDYPTISAIMSAFACDSEELALGEEIATVLTPPVLSLASGMAICGTTGIVGARTRVTCVRTSSRCQHMRGTLINHRCQEQVGVLPMDRRGVEVSPRQCHFTKISLGSLPTYCACPLHTEDVDRAPDVPCSHPWMPTSPPTSPTPQHCTTLDYCTISALHTLSWM